MVSLNRHNFSIKTSVSVLAFLLFCGIGQSVNAKTVTAVPAGFNECGKDFAQCNVSGNWTGYYGAKTNYEEISGSGAFTCVFSTFKVADPAPGVQKACYIKLASGASVANSGPKTVTSVPTGFNECAKDFGQCTASGAWSGYYGAKTTFVEISGKDSFKCLGDSFKIADPLPGVQKTCYIKLASAAAPAATSAAPTTSSATSTKTTTPAIPDNAISKPGDDAEIKRMRKQLEGCVTQVEDYKLRADSFKADVKSQKIKGLKESKQLAEEYTYALNQYNDYKTKNYPPNTDPRFNGFIMDQLNDCSGATDGFRNYWEGANTDNDRLIREYEASQHALSDAQAKIKPELENCVASLTTLQANNNLANENSKRIFNTKNPQLKTWAGVDSTISNYLKTYSVVYTDANLADCKKLAANTSVSDEFTKLTGQRAETVKNDAAADKKAKEEKAAAQEKKAAEEAAAAKAKIDAENAAKAAKEAADKDPKKIKECIDSIVARRNAIGARYYATNNVSAFDAKFKDRYDMLTKQVDIQVGGLSNSKETRLSNCLTPWPELDQLEKLVTDSEAKTAADRVAAEAAELKKQEERRAKAKQEYETWLKNNPTDIPTACVKTCTIRHAGPGPKEKECERVCAITSAAVKDTLNLIVDQTVVKALDEGLKQLGVTKAACEAASSSAAKIIGEGQKLIDSFKDKIKDSSEAACAAAKNTPERCRFVGRFIKFASDAKACSDAAGNLNKSLASTKTKYADREKLLNKSKNSGKVSKDEDSAIKEAVMDATVESASACEAVKASDIIKSIMAPCTDAASGTLWLGAHLGDF